MIHLSIPIANERELHRYRKGIFSVLSKVDSYTCKEALKMDIKPIYKLLDLLIQDSQKSDFASLKPITKVDQN